MQLLATRFQDSTISPTAPGKIETTLYDLIKAVNEEATPTEEYWVPLIVRHILESRKAKH